MRGGLGSSSIIWDWSRYGLEILHQSKRRVLKVRKMWGLIPTFVEVTVENLVGGGAFCSSSWIGLKSFSWLFVKLKKPFLTSTARSSHQRCSIKIGVLKNFTKFTGKHLCQSLFFNKVAGLYATLLKRDSGTGVFPWILWKF